MPTPKSQESNALDASLQPPCLPAENQKLEVYADYVAALEVWEEKLQGHVGWLKGHALLRAKQVSNAGYDAIISTFGWSRSMGFVYKAIAEKVTEDDAKNTSINELRRRVYKMKPTAADTTPEPETEPEPELNRTMYSVKRAFADLKAIKARLQKFRDCIGATRDAMNETQATPMALSSMDTQFHELRDLLQAADRARLEAVIETSTNRHDRVVEGVKLRLAGE
jgi:hypothetical protein